MSLINQVLQNLDERRASAPATPHVAADVRVPAGRRSRWRWLGIVASGAAGAAVAFAGALAWSSTQSAYPSAAGVAARPSGAGTDGSAIRQPMTSATFGTSTSSGVPPQNQAEAQTQTQTSTATQITALVAAPALGPTAMATAMATATATPPATATPSQAQIAEVTVQAALPPAASSGFPTSERNGDFMPASKVALSTARSSPSVAAPRRALDAAADIAPLASSLSPASSVEAGPARVEKRAQPLSPRERAEAAYQRGLALHQQGHSEEAQTAFMNALQEDRSHGGARQALAVSLASHGGAAEAESLLVEGLELQPRQLQWASTLARLRSQHHDVTGAIDVLKSALAANAGSAPANEQAQALALLATLQQNASLHPQAIDNYVAALRLVPGNGAWWIGLGLSLGADGRQQSAREAYARARTTDTLTPELQQFVDQRLRTATAAN